VAQPFPDLAAQAVGVEHRNLGIHNAGLDVMLHEPAVLAACRAARMTVLQVVDAMNMSNRLYRVHPRRNDRFIGASDLLEVLYPEVDFSQFHFTRHMLATLQATSEERFLVVEQELRSAWTARMRLLVERIGSPVTLLWFRPEAQRGRDMGDLSCGLIDSKMVDALRDDVADTVICAYADAERGRDVVAAPEEARMAQHLPGQGVHQRAAGLLAAVPGRMAPGHEKGPLELQRA
jgi:hypothetical protein